MFVILLLSNSVWILDIIVIYLLLFLPRGLGVAVFLTLSIEEFAVVIITFEVEYTLGELFVPEFSVVGDLLILFLEKSESRLFLLEDCEAFHEIYLVLTRWHSLINLLFSNINFMSLPISILLGESLTLSIFEAWQMASARFRLCGFFIILY